MTGIHLTRDLLWAASRGELPPGAIAQMGLEHLMSLCPTCRQEIERFQKEQTAAAGATGSSQVFQTVPPLPEEQPIPIEKEERQAERDLEDLLGRPHEERVLRVERSWVRFRSATLVRLLIAESRKRVQAEPGEALRLASLARLIAHRNPRIPNSFGLLALATAEMANACRVGDDPRQADEHFQHARYVITHLGVTDTAILGRIDHLEGSLRMDQRRFKRAQGLLTRAAMLYRVSGDTVETARVLITLGLMLFHRGDTALAAEATTAAIEGLRDGQEPRLLMNARYNLALFLTEDGKYDAAAAMLDADADLYRAFPEPWTQLRLHWLRGKITLGQGDEVDAEWIFLEVRDGFIAQGNGYDAAMVSIEDLAQLYARKGRTADLRRLAEEIYPIFQAQDVHREAMAALLLFQEAARQEALTVQAVREYATYFRDARADPSLRFGQGSPGTGEPPR
ncbi:MAG TPA: hypothetical protein VEL74_04990 [Thermoanaerobaculia bacterium]|nr:hypothetical protein [Thermoanaerobaculia bacterium]